MIWWGDCQSLVQILSDTMSTGLTLFRRHLIVCKGIVLPFCTTMFQYIEWGTRTPGVCADAIFHSMIFIGRRPMKNSVYCHEQVSYLIRYLIET